MSDYERNKQVLYPVTKELLDRLNIIDIFDLDFPRGSKFGAEGFIDYGGTKNYNKYLALIVKLGGFDMKEIQTAIPLMAILRLLDNDASVFEENLIELID